MDFNATLKELQLLGRLGFGNTDQAIGQHKLLQVGGLGCRDSIEQCQKMAILLTV